MTNNRDLSWLNFNDRVLQEAQDKSVPLLQRLRFLGIFSNNQDEFVKVRVANIVRMSQIREKNIFAFSGGYSAKKLLSLIKDRLAESQIRFEKTYEDILSEMDANGIRIINEKQLNDCQKQFCVSYFSEIITPRIVPLIIRRSTKMPFLSDRYIYHAVKMSFKHSSRYAVIQIPVSSTCPRFIKLPSAEGKNDIIYVDDIIRLCLDDIFFMFKYDKIEAYAFKLTRDAQFILDDDISKSLLEKMEKGLEHRLHGQPVRLVYDKDMPEDLFGMILSKLKLKEYDSIDAGGRYHLKRDLMKFPKIRKEFESEYPPALRHPCIKPFVSTLDIIRKQDVLLNYPYHTFNHFIDFLREVAIDPQVTTIYITLYRTAEHSKVINALSNAAKNGKEVLVLLELFARFDEEQNVVNTEVLQKAGVKVIHGANGLKVHSKLVLVQRKEKSSIKGYVYVGTGNFNESTAMIYSDFGLFTANPQIVADSKAVFDFLINPHKRFSCKKLLVSPYDMREKFEALINKEIRNAQKGKRAFIYAKFNSLTDEKIIKHLYKASQAGVRVRLIIRGSFCLQPKLKGVSDNIEAISIVDKYLEHARLVIFHNDGDEQIFILSADWMTRNLDRRVEVGVPILNDSIKDILKTYFDIQWFDSVKARDLSSFGKNNYVEPTTDDNICRSQTALYDYYKNNMIKKNTEK